MHQSLLIEKAAEDEKAATVVRRLDSEMCKGGIFDAGFGEILPSPHLKYAGKRKFTPSFTKPSLTDPTLGQQGGWVG